MKINDSSFNNYTFIKKHHDLLKGELPKVAPKQIDKYEDINFKEPKSNHRIRFEHNRELDRCIAQVIDNSTGETVKKILSDAEVDRMIRIERLKGIYLDEEV